MIQLLHNVQLVRKLFGLAHHLFDELELVVIAPCLRHEDPPDSGLPKSVVLFEMLCTACMQCQLRVPLRAYETLFGLQVLSEVASIW